MKNQIIQAHIPAKQGLKLREHISQLQYNEVFRNTFQQNKD